MSDGTGTDYAIVMHTPHDSPPWSHLLQSAPDKARVCFSGQFAGEPVQWDATVMTLSRYHREQGGGRRRRRNLIHIGTQGRSGRLVTVALDLPCIDQPALLKTVIMLRNYKRLRVGNHEFGAEVAFSE